jgi:hypothetical protein
MRITTSTQPRSSTFLDKPSFSLKNKNKEKKKKKKDVNQLNLRLSLPPPHGPPPPPPGGGRVEMAGNANGPKGLKVQVPINQTLLYSCALALSYPGTYRVSG